MSIEGKVSEFFKKVAKEEADKLMEFYKRNNFMPDKNTWNKRFFKRVIKRLEEEE